MTYAELQAHILALIGRAPASICYAMVTAELNNRLRLRATVTDYPISAEAEVPLPTNFNGIHGVWIEDGEYATALHAASVHQAAQARGPGAPRMFAVSKTWLYISPADGSDLVLRYYPKWSALSADDDTNEVLSSHPGIYIYGVLAHHARLIGDDRGALWQPAYEDAIKDAMRRDSLSAFSGPPAAPSPRAVV
jgi:hypothetical protein